MKFRAISVWAASAGVFWLSGCDQVESWDNWMPGKPKIENVWKAPTEITDFKELYAESCQGCHGMGNVVGAAIAMDNPTYLSLVTLEQLTEIISNGVKGTAMPAFAIRNGGLLTDEQIHILAENILAGKNGQPAPAGPLPPYAAPLGSPAAGEKVYAAYQAEAEKRSPGLTKDGFLTNPAFLDLVTDQYLRTLVIAGQPELGLLNWREAIPGQPLSDQEIADLVAWLASKRVNEFGQPVPLTSAPSQP
ncbi:MAG TPA: cytochrome c [Chthoniobacterales bacterium]